MLKIGVLEIGESYRNTNDIDIIDGTIKLAQLCDKLGYSRFWLGEHHDIGVAWSSPEILVSIIAGYTDSINVGAAGMQLPLSSPLRIAQSFKMLGTLFPGRIDLGIAKGAPPKDHIIEELLNSIDYKNFWQDHIPRIQKVIKFLKKDYLNIGDNKFIFTPPNTEVTPVDIWILGATNSLFDFVTKEKLNFSFSLIHSPITSIEKNSQLFASFLENYEKINYAIPKTNIAVSIACGNNKDECEALIRNNTSVYPIHILGEINECYDKINALVERFQIKEIILYFISNIFEDKIDMAEKIADLFKLNRVKELGLSGL